MAETAKQSREDTRLLLGSNADRRLEKRGVIGRRISQNRTTEVEQNRGCKSGNKGKEQGGKQRPEAFLKQNLEKLVSQDITCERENLRFLTGTRKLSEQGTTMRHLEMKSLGVIWGGLGWTFK